MKKALAFLLAVAAMTSFCLPASAAGEEGLAAAFTVVESAGDTVRCEISADREGAGWLICAGYVGDALADTVISPVALSYGRRRAELPRPEGERVRLFLLSADYRPLCTSSSVGPLPEISDPELIEAIGSGLVPEALQGDYAGIATSEDFCLLVDSLFASPRITEAERGSWQRASASARTSDPLIRDLLVLSSYEALAAVGRGERPNGDFLGMNNRFGSSLWSQGQSYYYPQWPGWEENAPFGAINNPVIYSTAAVFFALGQYSMRTGRRVIDVDSRTPSIRMGDAVTRAEAIVTVKRLGESIALGFEADETAEKEILSEADARRAAILNSPTEVSPTGTRYYVSMTEGDDNNDGLSPSSPIRTIARVNDLSLQPGDGVFFRRGDIWRGDSVYCRPGVTYSAYGTGEKPRFYGCAENGVGAGKWSLVYSDGSGKKIWKFYRDLPDVGGVIFNGGEEWAERVYGRWVIGRGLMTLDGSVDFDYVSALDRDLTCASVIDYSDASYYPINAYDGKYRGDFYLRCDRGNPGELYGEAEFEATDHENWWGLFCCLGGEGCTVDNISFRYYGDCAVQGGLEISDVTVQNCEVAWGGNHVHQFTEEGVYYTGDGIYGVANGGTVRNNYCHDVDGSAVRLEHTFGQTALFTRPTVIEGNLAECCGQGISICDRNDTVTFLGEPDLRVRDNYVLYNGVGYVHGSSVRMTALIFEGETVCPGLNATGNTVFKPAGDNFLTLSQPVEGRVFGNRMYT